ncbi:MAG: 2-phospho-L-lactate transferase CofD family protein, partial [bacterium]
AVIEKTGSLEKAIEELRKILGVKAEIYPVTLEKTDIKAILNDGAEVKGEEEILNYPNLSQIGIKKLSLDPEVKANPKAITAIKEADLVVIGPGKFYTSVISNFLAEGIAEAINKSKATKVFICNLMTQPGNTDNFRVEDFTAELEKYLGGKVDFVIFNTGRLPDSNFQFVGYGQKLLNDKKFIGADVLDKNIHQQHPSDTLAKGANQRTRILHDPKKLAKIIFNLCKL